MCNCAVQQQRAEYISTGALSSCRSCDWAPCCALVETQPSQNQHTRRLRIQWNMTDNSTLYHNRPSCFWRWCFWGFLSVFIHEHSAAAWAAVFPWWQMTYTSLSFLQFCIYSAVIMPSETVNTRTLLTCAWIVSQFFARRTKQKLDSITVQCLLSSQLSTLTQMPIEPVFSL